MENDGENALCTVDAFDDIVCDDMRIGNGQFVLWSKLLELIQVCTAEEALEKTCEPFDDEYRGEISFCCVNLLTTYTLYIYQADRFFTSVKLMSVAYFA